MHQVSKLFVTFGTIEHHLGRNAFKPNALVLQVYYLFTALDPIESSSLCTQN